MPIYTKNKGIVRPAVINHNYLESHFTILNKVKFYRILVSDAEANHGCLQYYFLLYYMTDPKTKTKIPVNISGIFVLLKSFVER